MRALAFSVLGCLATLAIAVLVTGGIPDAETLRTIALAAMALGQTSFTLLYVMWPWWERFLGRALFFKALVFSVLLDTYIAYRVFDLPHADEVFTALYYVLAAGVWAQFIAFLDVRLHKQQREVSGNRGK